MDIRGPDGRAVPVQMENLPDRTGVRASSRFKKVREIKKMKKVNLRAQLFRGDLFGVHTVWSL